MRRILYVGMKDGTQLPSLEVYVGYKVEEDVLNANVDWYVFKGIESHVAVRPRDVKYVYTHDYPTTPEELAKARGKWDQRADLEKSLL